MAEPPGDLPDAVLDRLADLVSLGAGGPTSRGGGAQDVAPILTNFFLLTYCLTNLATFLLQVSGLVNWRPTWRYFTWHTALFGAVLNLFVM